MILVVKKMQESRRCLIVSITIEVSKASKIFGIGDDIPPEYSNVFTHEVVSRLQKRPAKVANGLLGVHFS
jgi:hypothetical protein